ncbi:hypothetical protein MMC25_007325 [Agyrium rufum]|nr:hypothetical protein [Agyrium rufum]
MADCEDFWTYFTEDETALVAELPSNASGYEVMSDPGDGNLKKGGISTKDTIETWQDWNIVSSEHTGDAGSSQAASANKDKWDTWN